MTKSYRSVHIHFQTQDCEPFTEFECKWLYNECWKLADKLRTGQVRVNGMYVQGEKPEWSDSNGTEPTQEMQREDKKRKT